MVKPDNLTGVIVLVLISFISIKLKLYLLLTTYNFMDNYITMSLLSAKFRS